ILVSATTLPMPTTITADDQGLDHALVVAFAEQESDPAAARYVPGNTRMTQTPAFSVKPRTLVAAGDIVLAALQLKAGGLVEAVDGSVRTYAGLRLTGPGDNGF